MVEIDKDGINKMFELTNIYIGKSAIGADTAYSDSALFVKRKDIDCPNFEDAENMYSDYVEACVEQKKHFMENKPEYEKRDMATKNWSRCPQFDYETIKCVLLGLLLTSKYAIVQAICNDWKGHIREIYLTIVESLADEDNKDVCCSRKKDTAKKWNDYTKPTDSDYLISMNILKEFDEYIEKIYKMNDDVMEARVKSFVFNKVTDIVKNMYEEVPQTAEIDGSDITITTITGDTFTINLNDVKMCHSAEITNLLFLNKTD